jgi:hypothetical protein
MVAAGMVLLLAGSPVTGASPEPPAPVMLPQERAIAIVRGIDPRFAQLPDYLEAYQQAARELDMAPILAGSWINVLSTFEAQGLPWTDLGRGLLVEVMLVQGCPDTLAGSGVPGSGEPCEWRHSWIYRVLSTGEVQAIAEGGDPDG